MQNEINYTYMGVNCFIYSLYINELNRENGSN